MIGYTFKDMAREVLDVKKKPMSADQIWQQASELGLAEKVGSKGKTPARSIQAQLYMDIKESSDSEFVQLSKHEAIRSQLDEIAYAHFSREAAYV